MEQGILLQADWCRSAGGESVVRGRTSKLAAPKSTQHMRLQTPTADDDPKSTTAQRDATCIWFDVKISSSRAELARYRQA
jgi:hypothetical protein